MYKRYPIYMKDINHMFTLNECDNFFNEFQVYFANLIFQSRSQLGGSLLNNLKICGYDYN